MAGCMGSGVFQHGATVRIVLSCPILPVRTRLTALNQVGIERNSLSVRNTHLALAAASARIRPWAMHSPIGFSQQTSLPARIAARAMGTCQWSGVVIITASTSLRASTSRKSVVRKQPCMASRSNWCRWATATAAGFSLENWSRQRSTSHSATIRASAARANTGRLWAIACRPRPIIPTPMRLLGATFPSAPRAEAGMMVGIARLVPNAAPVAARKRRRERRVRPADARSCTVEDIGCSFELASFVKQMSPFAPRNNALSRSERRQSDSYFSIHAYFELASGGRTGPVINSLGNENRPCVPTC